MAHYHLHVRSGPKGKGAEHVQYIERGGRFKTEKYGEIGESERGNLPEWARGSAARFFAAADSHERANGNAYREFEMALPRELSELQRGQLVREFVAEQIGQRHAYAWAIHEPQGHNPHVHVMFSERLLDGIERGPEHYFKRANKKQPELGGQLKSDRFTGKDGPEAVQALRVRWSEMQNQALERAGVETRVDHRSLAAQGIEREAGQHRGPAVSGVEARGDVSEVSMRREAERLERAQSRAMVEAEVRVVTREEMAAEKVAVRERRELASEVKGKDRDLVLPLVEADRREQLGRVEAQAERRVERRQGLGVGELKDKLLTQARALRERVRHEIGLVKEWVVERFAEPLQRLKEHTRDLFGGGDKSSSRRREAAPKESQSRPDSSRALDAAERARVLKEATALGRQELSRQVQAVRDEQAARQRLQELVSQERERQRAQQLALERKQELERVQKKEQERSLSRGRGRGLGD